LLAAPRSRDEIRRFQQGRYVSSSEAYWHLLGFAMRGVAPNVVRLQVHLPHQHQVYLADSMTLKGMADANMET
jgi:hypothetical protein